METTPTQIKGISLTSVYTNKVANSNNFLQKNMVLTRTNTTTSSSIPANTNSKTNNNSNSSNNKSINMISFETRGSASFESREKKFNGKHSHKSRNHGRDEFIMLQRPTPIILAKPGNAISREIEKAPSLSLHRHKDENSRPVSNRLVDTRSTPPTVLAANHKSNGTSYFYDSGSTKVSDNNQPILGNLSTNLKSDSASKVGDHRGALKESSISIAVKEQAPSVVPAPDTLSARLTTASHFMSSAAPILDDNLSWRDHLLDYLIDQPDFLTVGVLGKRGCGKSTIMSLLAGTKYKESGLFKYSGKDTCENAQFKTNGIQAFVTTERTILLDVQPLLSSSVLDKTINMDKKHMSNDFKYYENYIEMQSIEIACFILSVCNVVLVTEDWFIDPNLFRVLQTAEMLMPNMSGVLNGPDDVQWDQKYPHLIYVLNKSEYVNRSDVTKMKFCIDNLLSDSKLIYKNSIGEMNASSHLIRARRSNKNKYESDGVNLVIMPNFDTNKSASTEFIGMASLEKSTKYLTREILAIKRHNSTGFTEKKWFSYANKVWDTIRKSSLVTEYNRLMT